MRVSLLRHDMGELAAVSQEARLRSLGFVAGRGKDGNHVMGHSRWTSVPGACSCSMTNAALIERAV